MYSKSKNILKAKAVRGIFLSVLFVVLFPFGKSYSHEAHGGEKIQKEHRVEIDPVCGMKIEVKPDTLKSEYKGKTYYFCSQECKRKFEKNPQKYVKP